MSEKQNIVVIGGGSGIFTLLRALSLRENIDVTAIVPLVDDGGSTGRLRNELGVSPPGDIRQALIAMSPESELRNNMEHRFADGPNKGHNQGNLLLAELEQQHGLIDAIAELEKQLKTQGHVIPSTLQSTTLVIKHGDQELKGEDAIDHARLDKPRKVSIEPNNVTNPAALDAIKQADVVIIGPGSLYGSLLSNLIAAGMSEALAQTNAKLVYNCNSVTSPQHTHGYSVSDYAQEIMSYLARPFDMVTYHNKKIEQQLIVDSFKEGAAQVSYDNLPSNEVTKYIGGDVVRSQAIQTKEGDPLASSRFRLPHDGNKLADLILQNI